MPKTPLESSMDIALKGLAFGLSLPKIVAEEVRLAVVMVTVAMAVARAVATRRAALVNDATTAVNSDTSPENARYPEEGKVISGDIYFAISDAMSLYSGERAMRFEENRCFECGETGHRARDCPGRGAGRTRSRSPVGRGRSASPAAAAPRSPPRDYPRNNFSGDREDRGRYDEDEGYY
ncbi:hypothetical protein BCR43DRAFT_104051 [Syncephalastrum racemosum]|uniref:CCHC-type domain-containing protein n=1 Tax=Syncephalastrum racemosum TaxID=13706 RepID=A0A1X2H1L5_SYNRA|nr:hypothetical protein BCR43DRAFT_104051 [Syncephalastrum racemosum]